MKKLLLSIIVLFLPENAETGYFEGEKKVSVRNCLEYFEKGKLLNSYINKYSISDTVERSDEYYEIVYRGKYYNLYFGYKVYNKNIKYIDGSECVTIDFDLENKEN